MAISRPKSGTTVFLLLPILAVVTAQFPDQFELNSFLYNAPPKTFEADFFRGGPRHHHGLNKNAAAAAMMSSPVPPALRSQNRKFLAKTPEHDKHFATILRQQDAATIRDPSQAAMVADDQMVLRGRGVSHSLQTSDDDVYEVESAPMEMKSRLPYRGPRGFQPNGHRGGGFPPNPHFQGGGYHRRAQFGATPEIEASEPEENDGEGGGGGEGGNEGGNTGVPVSVSFESNIDHSAYEAPEQPDQPEQNQHQQRENNNHNDEDDWSAPPRHKIMPLDGEPEEPSFNRVFPGGTPPQSGRGNRPRGGGPQSMAQQNMHFSMGIANDEGNGNGGGGESSYQSRPPARPHRGHHSNPGSSSSFQHQQQPYTHIQYMHMMPASVQSSASAEHSRPGRGSGNGGYVGPSSMSSSPSSSDEFRSPDWGPSSPALHEQSRAQHERELFGAPPVPGSKLDLGKTPMESSWLDMGAYSSGKGAFGWYSDVPVAGGGGNGGGNSGGGHQIMHKK